MGGKEGGKKKTRRRGKTPRKGRKHSSQKASSFYKVEGNSVKRVKKACPRCGPGTWLAGHKDRATCGKCGYSVSEKK